MPARISRTGFSTARNPDDASEHARLGDVYYGNGSYRKALTHYTRAAELQPDHMTYQRNLADFYLVKKNNLEKALEIYRRMLTVKPHDTDILLMAASIHSALGQNKEAKRYFKKAIQIKVKRAIAVKQRIRTKTGEKERMSLPLAVLKTRPKILKERADTVKKTRISSPASCVKPLKTKRILS